MDYIVSFLLLGVLLVLSTLFLYRHQKKIAREQLERSDPLQALDLDFGNPGSSSKIPGAESAEKLTTAHREAGSDRRDWQTAAREAREVGDLDAALRICQQQFPRSQAFRQAMVCLRAHLRTSPGDPATRQQHLGRLYRYAVVADLFSQNNTSRRRNRARRRQLSPAALEDLSINYNRIGYRYLKLLTKTDIALLRTHWGEPERHSHAEAVLGADWEDQLQLFGSGEQTS